MLMFYNYIFCKLKQHGILVRNSTFHTSLLLLQLNQSSLSSSQSFLACYFLFFPKCFCSPVFCCLSTSYTVLCDVHVDGNHGNLVASLATNTTNNGSEWQVWEMYMAITMSNGERTELPPVAEMLHHNGPEFFKPLHVSQIHQIRTNTMLQDCF